MSKRFSRSLGLILGIGMGLGSLALSATPARAGIAGQGPDYVMRCRVIRERVVLNTYPPRYRWISRRVCRPVPVESPGYVVIPPARPAPVVRVWRPAPVVVVRPYRPAPRPVYVAPRWRHAHPGFTFRGNIDGNRILVRAGY